MLDLGHFRLDLLGRQAGKISRGQLIHDCFPDPKAAEDTQKTDEGEGEGAGEGAGKGEGEEQQVVAAEVHAEPTGEEPGEQPGEQDYPLEDNDEEEEEDKEEDEDGEDEEDLQDPDFDAMIQEGVKAAQLQVKVRINSSG